MKTKLAVIPGGLTCQLQPLDVSINKAFKVALREEWNHYMMMTTGDNLTKTGRLKKPSIGEVSGKCGIYNSLDGSEDHLIYEDGDEDDTDEEELLAKFDVSDIEEDEECEGVVTIPDAPESDDECMSDYYES
ncbi:unnamed protein product [Protopolystoma xenopodis]|uniref:DDE-1 domain-containing protein n=1 Tax=Protopolystoma xenopodis TaxID=117903 RepID=A0A3S5B5Z6_9PLAT|nr:unnamed protein product [Protopolystoma xenopodis]